MSDLADRADAVIANDIAISLAAVRRAERIAPNGQCRFCDALVALTGQFCDVDCRDDFEKERAALLRSGKFVG
ncbi:hypothetical protein [Glaciimonas sp. PAMC28666]|uniref:hypothetical protein n=1 Tax=Glaciimonas sp. PAMC28666 TaxID=2807626 RepID=UPI0019642361|nr:hypothetical protein [Glaciimonas sp. PAMC28666]QRX82320.1 hypothetical protein JQN73_19880 [Glaciimonas sp. PAMC28666]